VLLPTDLPGGRLMTRDIGDWLVALATLLAVAVLVVRLWS
jgi:hypothetical protein